MPVNDESDANAGPWDSDCPSDTWPEICNACYGRAEYGQTWCDRCLGNWEAEQLAKAEAESE